MGGFYSQINLSIILILFCRVNHNNCNNFLARGRPPRLHERKKINQELGDYQKF